jgi:hypothetical protein
VFWHIGDYDHAHDSMSIFHFHFCIQLQTLLISHDTDAILILEHYFYLSQPNDQPVSSAAQRYNGSNTLARVGNALEDVFKHTTKHLR